MPVTSETRKWFYLVWIKAQVHWEMWLWGLQVKQLLRDIRALPKSEQGRAVTQLKWNASQNPNHDFRDKLLDAIMKFERSL